MVRQPQRATLTDTLVPCSTVFRYTQRASTVRVMTVTDTSTSAATSDEDLIKSLCDQLLEELPPKETDPVTFLGRQFDLGLAWVHFEEGRGGLGKSPSLQKLINETLVGAGQPKAAFRHVHGTGMTSEEAGVGKK